MKQIRKCIAWWLAIVLGMGIASEFWHPAGETQATLLRQGIFLLVLPALILASHVLLLGLFSVVVWFFRLLGYVLLWLHGGGWRRCWWWR